jgi:ketosteroid isomerase-like protein
MSLSDERKIAIARDYFLLADAGDPKLLELFHEDATFYFPKFGVGNGRASIGEMVKGFAGVLEWIRHDYDTLVFIPSGDRIAVEGRSQGKMVSGTWKGGETPGGRFCNVFEFRGERIARLFVYLDPDYLGEDQARFRWVREGRRW